MTTIKGGRQCLTRGGRALVVGDQADVDPGHVALHGAQHRARQVRARLPIRRHQLRPRGAELYQAMLPHRVLPCAKIKSASPWTSYPAICAADALVGNTVAREVHAAGHCKLPTRRTPAPRADPPASGPAQRSCCKPTSTSA